MSNLEQQMRHRDKEMVPVALVRAMFGLMILSVGLVAYAQWADVPLSGVPDRPPVVLERQLTVSGTRSGTYTYFAADGSELATSDDPQNGFLGVIGRVLARERMKHGTDPALPFRLVERDGGQIAILDDLPGGSGFEVELIGYGADNVAAFAKLLPAT